MTAVLDQPSGLTQSVGAFTGSSDVPIHTSGQKLQIRRPQLAIDLSDQTLPRPRLVSAALNQLNRLLELDEGWDGQAGRAISLPAAQTALWLILSLTDEDSAPPHVLPTVDGGVQVEWLVAGNGLEIEVDPSGGGAYVLAVDDSDRTRIDEEIDAHTGTLWPARRYLADISKRLAARRG